MATTIETLKKPNGDYVLPRTSAKAVSLENGTSVEAAFVQTLDEAKAYVDDALSNVASGNHAHNDLYYTETEIDQKIDTINESIEVLNNHNHDGNYDTKGSADNALSSAQKYTDEKIAAIPTVDTYTQAEIDEALNGKADREHNHNGLYYTESEVNDLLDNKADNSAIPTAISSLTDDSLHRTVTDSEKAIWNAKSDFSGSYNDLTNKPSIPSIAGLATESYVDSALSGKSDTTHKHDGVYDTKGSASAVQANLDVVSDTLSAHTGNADIHVTTGNKSNWNTAYNHSQATHARTDATKVEDSTTNGNILINGTETNVYSHPNSGVTAGTYKSVTVNAQGHVTGGTNPTTLAGYGITDAETKGAANSALASAKEYTDTVASGKSDTTHNHDSKYDAKGSADTALASAKSYADSAATTAANKVKNDLLNGAGTAYDTLKELGDLIVDNQDAIDALEIVATGKADKTHGHAISDVSGLQSALDGKAASSHGTHVSYSSTAPVMDGTASVGSASTVARSDHKHPTDTSRAAQTSLDSHTGNTTVHITSTERTNWNAAKTHADSAHAPSNAEKNQNAFSNITVGSTTVAADSATDTVTFVGSNITITPDATNDKITFSVADGSTSTSGIVKLTDSTSSTSTTTAATPNSVQAAYDLANQAKNAAATAQSTADGKAASDHTHKYAGSSSVGGAATSANKVTNALTVQLNGGTTEGTNKFTFDGSAVKAMNITASSVGAAASSHNHNDTYYTETEIDSKISTINTAISGKAASSHSHAISDVTNLQSTLDGKAASGHTHSYAGSSSAGGAATSANKVNNSLTVKLNSGTTEGTNLFTFNGSAAKVVNVTPSAIGASASSHTHDDRYYTEAEVDSKLSGKANSSHGNHVPATQTANNAVFLRNDNTWQTVTPANIGAAASSHTHDYLPLSGGSLNNAATIKLTQYGTRDLTIDGNSLTFDLSKDTGGWAISLANLYDATKTNTTMLGAYGSTSGVNWIYMGGSYDSPHFKITPDGVSYFKNTPYVGNTAVSLNGHTHDDRYYTETEIDTKLSGKASTSAATQSAAGLMSAADKKKLDGIATSANAYSHPTSSGNKHIPSGGSSGQILRWSADGTAAWGNDNNTTYSAATQSAAGLMSAADKTKLDGIATGANNYTYTLPTASSSTLGGVKTGSNITNSSGTISLTKANVTAALGYTPPTTNTTYGVVSTSADGLAPKRDGSTAKFLRGDGTWAVPPDTNTTYSVATQSAAGLMSIIDKMKLDLVPASRHIGMVQSGSYTGTGTSGASNPNQLTFDFTPKLIVINQSFRRPNSSSDNMTVDSGCTMLYGNGESFTIYRENNDIECTHSIYEVSVNNNNVSWYYNESLTFDSKNPAAAQLNNSGTVYNYVAIG